MSESASIPTTELQQAINASLDRRVVRIERSPYAYGSSFPLEQLAVHFEDGTQLDLIFKNEDPRALSAMARRAKPEFLDDPCREIELYRHVLDSQQLGTARCFGSVADPALGRYWLFLEKVSGRELYQVGEFDLWRDAARWLAHLHHAFAADRALPDSVRRRLVQHDSTYYQQWLNRAVAFHPHRFLIELQARYPEYVHALITLPAGLIHGEFYPSNILVQGLADGVRICAVDWERAGWGPGLIDLAALTSGKWTDAERKTLVDDYYSESQSLSGKPADYPGFARGLQLCQLHQAIQWLGWSPDWTPPVEHRQDWLAVAQQAFDLLEE